MKPLAYALVFFCSAVIVCSKKDPLGSENGRGSLRTLAPRISSSDWRPCCGPAQLSDSCDAPVRNREEAVALLATAKGQPCLDAAVAAIEKQAPDELSAAYFVRAQRLGDPIDFLRALNAAEETLRRERNSRTARFNRALAQEKLVLVREATHSWDEIWKVERSEWSQEARARRDALLARRDTDEQRIAAELQRALAQRDRAALVRLGRAFPSMMLLSFERSDVRDLATSRLYADALAAAGDPYARAVVDAVERTRDRVALDEGLRLFMDARARARERTTGVTIAALERSARLLERAGNPFALTVRNAQATMEERSGNPTAALRLVDEIAPVASRSQYRTITARIQTLHAVALDNAGRYLEALDSYDRALPFARGNANATADVLVRRSATYGTVGRADLAFRDAYRALYELPGVTDLNPRHQAYSSAALAAQNLGYPSIALHYQNAAVDAIQRARANAINPADAKHHLGVALRLRADIHIALRRDADAAADLAQAADLAEAVGRGELRALLKMRLAEVSGQSFLMKNDPRGAVQKFTEAISLASGEHSSYRAVLLFKRATARRLTDDPGARDDTAVALQILRDEASRLLDTRKRGEYEELWTSYFARFQAMYHDMIERGIAEGDVAGAFLYAEQARAFEPMQLVLQSQTAPPGFRKLETREDLERELARLPARTVILQYVVLDRRTFTFVLRRDSIEVIPQRAGRKEIERWVSETGAALRSGQSGRFATPMRAAYDELFRAPLALLPPNAIDRFVIIPDGPMHALPFAALRGRPREGYLIERGSIAVAGSTSLYLYALARDRQFSGDTRPTVLVVGEPAIDPGLRFSELKGARKEAEEIAAMYGTTPLLGADATIARFLGAARTSTIVHFAGHGVANAASPRHSMLLLAPRGHDRGRLTAERLMTELSELERTRLVVLAACSTAGGQPIGPEGVAPLVRPLIAANVPAVVGTLWDVKDATAKDLLVSLHRHYRNGADVAAALRFAQLEMLRNNEPAMTWAAFQVVGHAASPHARPAAMEENQSDHVRTENSLHRPDGLRSQ